MRIIPTESQESITLTKYLVYRRLCFMHTPNEGRRSWQNGRMLKAMGMKKGFPDYLIFNRTRSGAHGMAIELKRTRGGILAPEQKQWLLDLQAQGWVAVVAFGAGAAIKMIDREY